MEQPEDSLPASELRKPDFFEVEKLTVLLMPAGYSWPASGLIGYDVARLHALWSQFIMEIALEQIPNFTESVSSDRFV